MDFIGDKSKTSEEILKESLQRIGSETDIIVTVELAIKEIYKRFVELGLKIDCMCYNCEAAIVNMNFCPFCGVDLDGPTFDSAVHKLKGSKLHSVGDGGGRKRTWNKESRVSGASLFEALIDGIDDEFFSKVELKYRNTVISFWHKYCKCFSKAFVGKWSMRIHLPFKKEEFSNQDIPINMARPQHNFASRLLVVSHEEVDIARALVLEAFALKTEQRHKVLARRAERKEIGDVDLCTSNDGDDTTKTDCDGEQAESVHLQEGSQVQGEEVAEESCEPIREEDHGRSEETEA